MVSNLSLWLRSMRLLPQGELFFFGKTSQGEINCCMDKSGRTNILIPIREFPKIDLNHNFLEPRCIDHPLLGSVLEISWARKEDDEIALLFFEDLISTDSFSADPVATLTKKLLVWKDFLMSGGGLRLNELIGLWGELLVAVNWPVLSPYWIGPDSSDVDYKSDEYVFDVKTTRSKQTPEVKISTEHQLEWHNQRIFICRIRIEEGTNDDLSLLDLFNRIRRDLIPSHTLKALDSKVFSLPVELTKHRFVCREIAFFELSGSPSLINKTTLAKCIGNEAMNRISGLTYNLSLSGINSITPDTFVTTFHPQS